MIACCQRDKHWIVRNSGNSSSAIVKLVQIANYRSKLHINFLRISSAEEIRQDRCKGSLGG